METKKHQIFIILITISVGLGGTLYGYDIGVISGALLFIHKTIPLSQDELGMIVGAVLGGGLIGTLVTGPLADKFGRKTMILLACLIFALGIVLVLQAMSFVSLLIARILLGVAVGVVAVAIPLYLAEVAPARLRGRSVGIFQLFLTGGILLAYIVGMIFTPTENWHAMFAVILIPTIILFISMLLLPESPRWLLSQGKSERARAVLMKTRSPQEASDEFKIIEQHLHSHRGKWRDIFARQLWLPLMISIAVAALNQLTGINVFFQYGPLVLKEAGFNSNMVSMLGTVGMGLVNFVITIVALTLIDRLGRRFLLMLGTAGIVFCQLVLGILQHMHAAPILTLVVLLMYIVAFAIGPGVVVWLVISELMPTKVRGKSIALCLFINSLSATILSTIFLPIVDSIGLGNTYFLFAIFSIVYFFIAAFLLPETKMKSLEQVQQHFQKISRHQKLITTVD